MKNHKTILLAAAAIAAGILGVQIATATLNPSTSTTPVAATKYGVARLEAQYNPPTSYTTFTITINATQGPVYLEGLQVETARVAGASILNNIIANGIIYWPSNNARVTVTTCSPDCYGELIGAIESSNPISTGTNINELVKDPIGNQAVAADTGSHSAQSLQIQFASNGISTAGDTLSAAAMISAPSSSKVTMSISTP